MSAEEARPAADASAEISALIEVLHRTGQRLEELTGGEVDAVSDRDGRTFVLRQAQEQLRRIEAARQVAVLDALPASVALLDAQGVILSVNSVWRQFAGANAIQGSDLGIGLNCLEICDTAQGAGAAEAQQVAAGIRSVLSGESRSFSIEYPCHSATEKRWFLMTATPLAGDPPHGAVVMHLNITPQKKADQKFKDLLDAAPDAMVIVNSAGEIVLVNLQATKLFGWRREDLVGHKIEMLVPERFRGVHQESRNGFMAEKHARSMGSGLEQFAMRQDGSEFPIEVSLSPLADDDGPLVISAIRDVTERRKIQDTVLREKNFINAALDSLPGMFYVISDQGQFLRWNRNFEVLSGYSSEEVSRLSPIELIAGPDKALVADRIRQVFVTGESTVEADLVAKDQTKTSYFFTGALAQIDQKPCLIGMGIDITTRKRAEESLIESEQELRAIFDGALDGILVADAQSRKLVAANGEICRMFGYTHEEILCIGVSDMPPAQDLPHVMQQFERVLRGEIQMAADIPLMRKDGSVFYVDIKAASIRFGGKDCLLGIFRDITERKQAEEARQHRAEELQESQRIARIGSWEWTIATGAVAWSDGLNHVLGRDPGSPAPSFETLSQFYTAESWQRLGAVIATTIETAAPYEIEVEMIRPDGAPCWITARGEAIRGADGSVVKLRGTAHDITTRREAETRIAYLNRVYAMLSGINTLIVRVHERDELFREACRIAVEAGGFRMVWIGGIDRNAMKIVPLASAGVDDEMLGTIKDHFSLNEDLALGNTMAAQAIRDKTAVVANDSQNDARLVFPRQHAQAGIRSMAILPLLVADEAVGVFALYASEVNFFQEEELKLIHELAGDIAFAMDHLDKQARLDYLAYYDELTGLANRGLFLERLAQYQRGARSRGHKLGLFLVDLERFRNINDSLGRPAGDVLLRQVAQRLTHVAGDASLVARIGSDVFAMVLPEIKPGGSLARLIEGSMNRFLEHPFRLDDVEFRMAIKVGVAIYPDDGSKAETLFRNAEAALYHAKSSGLRYQFYTQAMTESVAGRLTLENELRRAIEHGEFILHYQPKVSCGSGKISGFEALLRWQHPQRGLVPPVEFVSMLELTGLIVPVGDWVLSQACAQARRWHDAGLGLPSMAVNVSGRQMDLSDLCATVGSALAASGLPPACLELEFTEGQLMKDAEGVIDLLRRLKAIGVQLSVDDFGTGYSSLAYLKRFPLDSLKVDRAFVRDITADPNDVSITRAIITLAHSLKLKVVAEGVETEGQLGLLIANHCDEIQGYYFSRPLPADEATALLRAGPSLQSRMMVGMKRRRTLLLVDDEANILSALKRLLRQDGYEILSALGGAQGLELLAGHPVDVIIADQRMPGMSGVDFLRRVKVLHPETVRLVLSGYTDLQSVTDAVNEGAIYKFMTKPWVDEELRSTIVEAFRSKELADQSRGLRPAMTADKPLSGASAERGAMGADDAGSAYASLEPS